MPNSSKVAEAIKLSHNTRFAVLGRTIADVAECGGDVASVARECELARRRELDSVDRSTQFAAIARQIGDELLQGREINSLVHRARQLRRNEIG